MCHLNTTRATKNISIQGLSFSLYPPTLLLCLSLSLSSYSSPSPFYLSVSSPCLSVCWGMNCQSCLQYQLLCLAWEQRTEGYNQSCVGHGSLASAFLTPDFQWCVWPPGDPRFPLKLRSGYWQHANMFFRHVQYCKAWTYRYMRLLVAVRDALILTKNTKSDLKNECCCPIKKPANKSVLENVKMKKGSIA